MWQVRIIFLKLNISLSLNSVNSIGHFSVTSSSSPPPPDTHCEEYLLHPDSNEQLSHSNIHGGSLSKDTEQECIPVGCVPSAAVAV